MTTHLNQILPINSPWSELPDSLICQIACEELLGVEDLKSATLINRHWHQPIQNNTFCIIASQLVDSQSLVKFRYLKNLSVFSTHTIPHQWRSARLSQDLFKLHLGDCSESPNYWSRSDLLPLTALSHLTHLKFVGLQGMTDESLEILSKWTQLKKLSLRSCFNIRGEGLCHLTSLSNLKSLELKGQSFDALASHGAFGYIDRLPALDEVDFGPLNPRDIDILVDHPCTKLQRLELRLYNNKSVSCLQSCLPHLSKLTFQGEIEPLDQPFMWKQLEQLPKLAHLEFVCSCLNFGNFEDLRPLTKLTHFSTPTGAVNQNQSLCALSRLCNLQSFGLQTLYPINAICWYDFNQLKHLNLEYMSFGTASADSVTRLENLKTLRIVGADLPPGFEFERFAAMAELQTLELHQSQDPFLESVRPKIARPTRPFPKLRVLKVYELLIDSERIEFLKTVPNLLEFYAECCAISPSNVALLKGSKLNGRVYPAVRYRLADLAWGGSRSYFRVGSFQIRGLCALTENRTEPLSSWEV